MLGFSLIKICSYIQQFSAFFLKNLILLKVNRKEALKAFPSESHDEENIYQHQENE
jgi:hypothetical protein